jgi:hypothetical protein
MSVKKRHAPTPTIELEDEVYVASALNFSVGSYFCFNSIEITPPPTPSPVKAAGGKKRAIANGESDEDDVFVPRYDI